jgi:hypothetical protein
VTHTTLTAAFFDPHLREALHAEHQQPPWFQQDEAERAGAKTPWGPANPQDLNRYAYALNNPLRYTDSTGHIVDTLLDVGFIAYGVYDIAANGSTHERGLALAADV